MVKEPKQERNHYFVDEAGDPNFFNKHKKVIVGDEGCSKVLLIGFIESANPKEIRKAVNGLLEELKNDDYLSRIYSFKERTIKNGFHAKDDRHEIREKFFKLIKKLDFKCQIFIARKDVKHFINRFDSNSNKFYDHVVTKLFENRLHLHAENLIYFSERGSSERLGPLKHAINLAKENFKQKRNHENQNEINVIIERPLQEPCLQVIDYMNWALYRGITTNDYNYFEYLQEKYSLIVDLFDQKAIDNGWKNYYSKDKNLFHPKKMSPL